MSITDELRKWAEDNTLKDRVLATCPPQHAVHGVLETLLRIAERIDAEHERAVMSAMNDALYYANDESMAELGWVRLPVDADGMPIRFGDKVTVPWSKKVYEVRGFSYTQRLASGERTIWVDVYNLEMMRNVPLCGASGCHHYHAPTVEDVLREMMRDAACQFHDDGSCEMGLTDEQFTKYAQRLQLREAGDAE